MAVKAIKFISVLNIFSILVDDATNKFDKYSYKIVVTINLFFKCSDRENFFYSFCYKIIYIKLFKLS